MIKRYICFILIVLFVTTIFAQKRVYTIGDSIVQIWGTQNYPKTGWGQVLQYFFETEGVLVIDKAVGGTTSKSFYESHWAAVKGELKSGDILLIQFGINDWYQGVDAMTAYKSYLTSIIDEARNKGAYPVLVTTVCGNNNTYDPYPTAVKELGASLSLPVIDLNTASVSLREEVGKTYASHFLFMNLLAGEYTAYPNGEKDDTHIQEIGAIDMARFVVAGFKQMTGNEHITPLLSHLRPMYKVNFTINDPQMGIVSRSEYFPVGIPVTAKALPNKGYKFSSWEGDLTGNNPIVKFTMGASDKNITANFMEGEPEQSREKIENGNFSQWSTAIKTGQKPGEYLYPSNWSFTPTPGGTEERGGVTKWGDVIFSRAFNGNFVEIAGRNTPYEQRMYQTVSLEQSEAYLSVAFKGSAITPSGNPEVKVFIRNADTKQDVHTFSLSDLSGYNMSTLTTYQQTVSIPSAGNYEVGVYVKNENSGCWVQVYDFSLKQFVTAGLEKTVLSTSSAHIFCNTHTIEVKANAPLRCVTLFNECGKILSRTEVNDDYAQLERPTQPGVYIILVEGENIYEPVKLVLSV